jgi:dipeptidyl aminopeptidase/acylaminoacyl peptidase
VNAAPGKVPLVVLPHGGPYARDHWGFDGWVQFLASRGYAVLQIEYRGSTGYGHDWFRSGLADWGGLPHSDVVDGTNWAIEKGYADADRVCIVGASFGGFMALTGATRDGKLYRCAMSISGVSDLNELVDDRHFFAGWKIARQAIGKDSSKLKRDSPRLSAAEVQIPIMLLHGDQDFTVEVDQSVLMDKALTEAGKAHEFVIVKGADHYFREEVYMRALFTNMERFLTKNLGPGAPEAP